MAGYSRSAPPIKLLVNRMPVPNVSVMHVTRHINFREPDSAVFVAPASPTSSGDYFEDTELRDIYTMDGGPIQVAIGGVGDGNSDVPIHYGRVVAVETKWGPDGEMREYTSRFDAHMFGMYRGVDLWAWASYPFDFIARGIEKARVDLQLNPLLDGTRYPNCATGNNNEGEEVLAYITPRGLPRHPADLQRLVNDEHIEYWTLPKAIELVCSLWNPDEWHVENPTRAELERIFDGQGISPQDITISRTSTLPEVLTQLLRPHGFTWCIEHHSLDRRQIIIQRRQNADDVRSVYVQKFGEQLDTVQTRCNKFHLTFDAASNVVTNVAILPEAPIVEGTFELVPAWDKQYDTAARTETDQAGLEAATHRVWRDWVLNEAWHYEGKLVARRRNTGIKYGMFNWEDFLDTIFADLNDAPVGLQEEGAIINTFGNPIWRHVFGRMLTVGEDGSPLADSDNGVWLEYWTRENEEAGQGPREDGWQHISKFSPNITFNRLENECGIRFTLGKTGQEAFRKIPVRFRSNAETNDWEANFKLRVTATIQLDAPYMTHARMPNDVLDFAATHLQDPKVTFIEGKDKWRYRFVHSKSRFYDSQEFDDASVSDDVLSQLHAATLFEHWMAASCSGSFALPGLDLMDTRRALGLSVSHVVGKNFGLNLAHKLRRDKFPTIAGITYDIQRQSTQLHIETFRRGQ